MGHRRQCGYWALAMSPLHPLLAHKLRLDATVALRGLWSAPGQLLGLGFRKTESVQPAHCHTDLDQACTPYSFRSFAACGHMQLRGSGVRGGVQQAHPSQQGCVCVCVCVCS